MSCTFIYIIKDSSNNLLVAPSVFYLKGNQYLFLTFDSENMHIADGKDIFKLDIEQIKELTDCYVEAKETQESQNLLLFNLNDDSAHFTLTRNGVLGLDDAWCVIDIPIFPSVILSVDVEKEYKCWVLHLSRSRKNRYRFRNTYTNHHAVVYDYIYDHPDCTYQEISRGIGRSKQYVLKRLGELIFAKRIRVTSIGVNSETNRPISKYRVV